LCTTQRGAAAVTAAGPTGGDGVSLSI
jgi:hypothetical protein